MASEGSNIHDVHIDKGIVPWPRGVYEDYKKRNKIYKLKQAAENEKLVKFGKITKSSVEKLKELPIELSDLPWGFKEQEGKRLGKLTIWPKCAPNRPSGCTIATCWLYENKGWCPAHGGDKPSVDN